MLEAKGYNSKVRYSVWDNTNDKLVILDGKSKACAKAMGIAFSSFYPAVSKAKNGIVKKWTIEVSYLGGE